MWCCLAPPSGPATLSLSPLPPSVPVTSLPFLTLQARSCRRSSAYSWELPSSKSSPVQVLHINQMSVQNPPSQVPSVLLLMKGSKGCPPPLISILILCLIFFLCWSWPEVLLFIELIYFYYCLSSAQDCVFHVVGLGLVSHCLPLPRPPWDTWQVLYPWRRVPSVLSLSSCIILAGWDLPLYQQDLCPEEHL